MAIVGAVLSGDRIFWNYEETDKGRVLFAVEVGQWVSNPQEPGSSCGLVSKKKPDVAARPFPD